MKHLITLFVFSLFIVSCADKKQNSLSNKTALSTLQIEILDIDNLKTQEGQINAKLEKFKIGKSINGKANHRFSTDQILNKEFINVTGFDEKGNFIAYRQEVIKKPMGDNFVITFVEDGVGETCTGVNCSDCKIEDGGGCNSQDSIDPEKPSYCNHTVTNESAIITKNN
jgi:hypothetical protein